MDPRVYDAAVRGDVAAFLHLLHLDEAAVDQVTPELNTCLHVAARFGHVDLAREAVQCRPGLVTWQNKWMETPLFVACREGETEMVGFLMEVDAWVAFKPNHEKMSPLCVASAGGHLNVVRHLLSNPRLLAAEDKAPFHPLLMAVFSGHTAIVRELLHARPQCALVQDKEGCSALHVASWKGHVLVTRELLNFDPSMCVLQDNEGRTPLHLAADRGHVSILAELLSHSLDSTWMVTNLGETILHFSVRNNRHETVKYLVEKLDVSSIVNMPDNDGNTILHVATFRKLPQMVEYLVFHTSIDVNARNGSSLTALDIINQDISLSSSSQQLEAILKDATKVIPDKQAIKSPKPRLPVLRTFYNLPATSTKPSEKNGEMKTEGLQSARDTLTVIASLIASACFAAGINPPGGVYQDGLHIGKSVLANTTAFQTFILCNYVALFLSLGIVIVLVTIIPFEYEELRRLLQWGHLLMWLAVIFMSLSYVAATWALILGNTRGLRPVLTLVAVAIMGLVFVVLQIFLVRHRKQKRERGCEHQRRSTHISPLPEHRSTHIPPPPEHRSTPITSPHHQSENYSDREESNVSSMKRTVFGFISRQRERVASTMKRTVLGF